MPDPFTGTVVAATAVAADVVTLYSFYRDIMRGLEEGEKVTTKMIKYIERVEQKQKYLYGSVPNSASHMTRIERFSKEFGLNSYALTPQFLAMAESAKHSGISPENVMPFFEEMYKGAAAKMIDIDDMAPKIATLCNALGNGKFTSSDIKDIFNGYQKGIIENLESALGATHENIDEKLKEAGPLNIIKMLYGILKDRNKELDSSSIRGSMYGTENYNDESIFRKKYIDLKTDGDKIKEHKNDMVKNAKNTNDKIISDLLLEAGDLIQSVKSYEGNYDPRLRDEFGKRIRLAKDKHKKAAELMDLEGIKEFNGWWLLLGEEIKQEDHNLSRVIQGNKKFIERRKPNIERKKRLDNSEKIGRVSLPDDNRTAEAVSVDTLSPMQKYALGIGQLPSLSRNKNITRESIVEGVKKPADPSGDLKRLDTRNGNSVIAPYGKDFAADNLNVNNAMSMAGDLVVSGDFLLTGKLSEGAQKPTDPSDGLNKTGEQNDKSVIAPYGKDFGASYFTVENAMSVAGNLCVSGDFLLTGKLPQDVKPSEQTAKEKDSSAEVPNVGSALTVASLVIEKAMKVARDIEVDGDLIVNGAMRIGKGGGSREEGDSEVRGWQGGQMDQGRSLTESAANALKGSRDISSLGGMLAGEGDSSRTFADGFRDFINKLTNDAEEGEKVVNAFATGVENLIVTAFKTGEFAVEDFFATLMNAIMEAVIQAMIIKPLLKALGFGVSAAFGGGGGGGVKPSASNFGIEDYNLGDFTLAPSPYLEKQAKGGVFSPSGQLDTGIVSQPASFAYNGGFGVMGEAGAEGILPLGRSANGELGVKVVGGGNGSPQQVNVQVFNESGQPVKAGKASAEMDMQSMVISIWLEGYERNSMGLRDVVGK